MTTIEQINGLVANINKNLDVTNKQNDDIGQNIGLIDARIGEFIKEISEFQKNVFLKLLTCCKHIGEPENEKSNENLTKLLQELNMINKRINTANNEFEQSVSQSKNIVDMLENDNKILTQLLNAIQKFNLSCKDDCNYLVQLDDISKIITTILIENDAKDMKPIYDLIGISGIGQPDFNYNLAELTQWIHEKKLDNIKNYIKVNYLLKLLANNKIDQPQFNQYVQQLLTSTPMKGGRLKKSSRRFHKRSYKRPRRRFKRGSKRAPPRRTHKYRFHK